MVWFYLTLYWVAGAAAILFLHRILADYPADEVTVKHLLVAVMLGWIGLPALAFVIVVLLIAGFCMEFSERLGDIKVFRWPDWLR